MAAATRTDLPNPDTDARRVAEVVGVGVVAPDPGADQERGAAPGPHEAVAGREAPAPARPRAAEVAPLAALERLQLDDLPGPRHRQAAQPPRDADPPAGAHAPR